MKRFVVNMVTALLCAVLLLNVAAGAEELSEPRIAEPLAMVYLVPLNGVTYIEIEAEGTGLCYQWQYLAPGSDNWTNCSCVTEGYHGPSLEVIGEERRQGYRYRCLVTDAMGNQTISDEVELEVMLSFGVTVQPENQTVPEGEPVTFQVCAIGEGLTYQWLCICPGGELSQINEYYPVIGDPTDYNSDTLHITADRNLSGTRFLCRIEDARGFATASWEAVLTVN